MFESVKELEAYCLKVIGEGQAKNGEFKTYLFFPEKKENGWIYAQPSVFITSSIAITLIESSDNEQVQKVIDNSAKFVHSQMEECGLWRFYPHDGLFKFNTPMDVDDTCLASYLLEKCNIEFPDNKKFLLKQIDTKGNFYVWFLPRLRYLSMPGFLWTLFKDIQYSFPIFFPMKGRTTAPLIRYNDHEHAVSSNAVLYLGKSSATQKSIHHITEDVLFGSNHNLFFYPDFLFTFYHISRAFSAGITDFYNVKEMAKNYIVDNKKSVIDNIMNIAITLITLKNFKIEIDMIDELKSKLIDVSEKELTSPHAYFCTKDRNMVGGSAEFTCAIVYSALKKCF